MENQLPPLLLLLLLVPSGVCGPELQLDVGTEAPLGGTARLRCRYTGAAQVTQVTWDKLTELGPQMVAVRSDAHGTRTHPFYGARARFQRGDEHGGGALDGDASLLIHQLVLADAGRFRCKVFTFPAGSFEGDTGLTVLVPPQVWLVPSPRALLEGDRHALVATCMVMGSTPLPQVWWDTAVEGEQEMTDTANANGTVTVTSSLYIHPERDMKGKDAVCTVNHSSLAQPLHVPYKLNVYHVPEVMIKRSSENWQADMEGAALQCEENGNPPATDFVWTRMGDPLPSNLTQDGSRLLFTKRLTVEDSGTYVCEVSNEIGSRSAKMKITISDPNVAEMSLLTLAFVAIGVVGLVLVLIFIGAMIAVNRSHRKKTEQMVFKLEEISTMSRQPSIRRCNSMSASVDIRLQEAGGSRDIDQLELEPMMEEMVPPQRSSSRDLLAVPVGGQFQPLPLGTHRYSLRSTTSEPRYSPAYPFGAYRNSLPSNQRHSLREWVLNHSERSGSPGDVPEISSRELTAALEQVSSLSPRSLTPSPSEQGSQTEDEEEVADRQKSIHAAMGHFYPHNGTLRAKPGSSTVYIARREHCV